jgi:hypothetical protein
MDSGECNGAEVMRNTASQTSTVTAHARAVNKKGSDRKMVNPLIFLQTVFGREQPSDGAGQLYIAR